MHFLIVNIEFDFEMTFVLLLQINETSRRMSGLIYRCIQQVRVILLSQKRMNGMFDAMSAVNTVGSRVNGYAGKMDRRPYVSNDVIICATWSPFRRTR